MMISCFMSLIFLLTLILTFSQKKKNLPPLPKKTPLPRSFTGADLAALVRSAATLAAEEGDDGAESVGARHFAEALKGARPSRRVGGGGSGSGSGSGSVEENGKEAEPVFASFSRPGLG